MKRGKRERVKGDRELRKRERELRESERELRESESERERKKGGCVGVSGVVRCEDCCQGTLGKRKSFSFFKRKTRGASRLLRSVYH